MGTDRPTNGQTKWTDPQIDFTLLYINMPENILHPLVLGIQCSNTSELDGFSPNQKWAWRMD